ncbi:restriction endonuclease subunit S [bacterium]|nr:restriction endonuclease subunit S [bacterium]
MRSRVIRLDNLIESLESGSRPRGGAIDVLEGVPSLGAEHLNSTGSFCLQKIKYIPEKHFAMMRSGIIYRNDILVVKDGATTGKTSLVRDDFPFEQAAVNEHVFVVRVAPSKAEARYVFYYLFSRAGQTQIMKDFRGATIGGISRQFPSGVEIPLPSLSEQRRIVKILDQADALRKKRAEADARAARILPALFYKMFGDPATNPMGWPVIPIRHLVVPIKRRDPAGQPDNAFVYVDIAGVDGPTGTIVETKNLLGAEAPSRARQIIRENDVVISTVRPYLRATALVPERLDDQICSTGFCVLRARKGRGFGFLYALSRLQWFTEQLNARARGASYPAVTDRDILNLAIPWPDTSNAHEAFDAQVVGVLAMRQKRSHSATALENLFASLLHRAFTGELTASWRESHMKELLVEMEQQAKALEAATRTDDAAPEVRPERHAGYDMYHKAALAAYIVGRCHSPKYPLGRVRLAKLFYLLQKKAGLELTKLFAKRAAGPLDDHIHKFLNLAQKKRWLVLERTRRNVKSVSPGQTMQEGVAEARKLLGEALPEVNDMLDQMKGWSTGTLERWATVLHAAEELIGAGGQLTDRNVKRAIEQDPTWRSKLSRDDFANGKLSATLSGLIRQGFIRPKCDGETDTVTNPERTSC